MTTLDDFHQLYHQTHLVTRDADPDRLVLAELYDTLQLDGVDRLRFTMLYLAVQQIGTAAWLFTESSDFREAAHAAARWHELIGTDLKCGPERRGHSDPDMLCRHLLHLQNLSDHHEGIDGYLLRDLDLTPDDALKNWGIVRARVEKTYGNGEWAGYRTMSLLTSLHGWDLEPLRNNSDPMQRRGLRAIYPHLPAMYTPTPRVFDQYDDAYDMLTADLVFRMMLPTRVTLSQSLRTFDLMRRGRYHLGKNLDQQLIELNRVNEVTSLPLYGPLLQARFQLFDEQLLQEQRYPALTLLEHDKAADLLYKTEGRIMIL